MKRDRRSFLKTGPAGAIGLGLFAPFAEAQSPSAARGSVATDVVDFWVNRVGVPAEMVLGPVRRGAAGLGEVGFRGSNNSFEATYGNEPLFLYVDEAAQHVIPAQDISKDQLQPGGDALVEMQVGRLRLNEPDQSRFENLSSSGLYFDVEQKPAGAENVVSLGWSLFGALFPEKYAKVTGRKMTAPAAVTGDSGLMKAIALPGGTGKTMFNCFLKDGKKSAFGSFLATCLQAGYAASSPFVPMLHLPGVSTEALSGIRALVAKLQGFGGDQHWLFQNRPLDIACTAEAAAATGDCVRFRTGHYIVVPKSQASQLSGSKGQVKLLDGFLVPKEATRLDVYDAAPTTAPGLTYLSLRVNVRKAQLNGCPVMAPIRR